MVNIAAKFAQIVEKTKENTFSPESALGVFIHAYRRKRNLNLEQLANQWGLDEESLLRIECGYGSPEEIQLILLKIHAEKN